MALSLFVFLTSPQPILLIPVLHTPIFFGVTSLAMTQCQQSNHKRRGYNRQSSKHNKTQQTANCAHIPLGIVYGRNKYQLFSELWRKDIGRSGTQFLTCSARFKTKHPLPFQCLTHIPFTGTLSIPIPWNQIWYIDNWRQSFVIRPRSTANRLQVGRWLKYRNELRWR